MARRKGNSSQAVPRASAPPDDLGPELTLEPIVALVQAGKLSDARRLCERYLDAVPDWVAAWHLSGLLEAQAGNHAAGIERMKSAVARDKSNTRCWSDLGQAHWECGQLNEAVAAFQRVIELDPVQIGVRERLARALQDLDRHPEALEVWRELLRRAPQRVSVYRGLIAELRYLGDFEEAARVCEQWLAVEPDQPVALHLQAALQAVPAPTRASDRYVRTLFDEFSEYFDEELESLGYQAPQLVMKALAGRIPDAPQSLILDAGCGTGLCGNALRSKARCLMGVDLSSGMLRQARRRDVYDDLTEAELTEYLNRHPGLFDVIVSCDTLNYFGELRPPLTAARNALRPGGWLVVTLEHDTEETTENFRLHTSGRFVHTKSAAMSALEDAGLQLVELTHDSLRHEAGVPVPGMLIVARCPAA